MPTAVQALEEAREAARKSRDWPRADALRKEIAEAGWEVADTPAGPVARKKGRGGEGE